jgi:hypothetical protein
MLSLSLYIYMFVYVYTLIHTYTHNRLENPSDFDQAYKADERRVRSLDLTRFKTPTGWRQPLQTDHLQAEIDAMQSMPLP